MRRATRSCPYICLPRQIQAGKSSSLTRLLTLAPLSCRNYSSSVSDSTIGSETRTDGSLPINTFLSNTEDRQSIVQISGRAHKKLHLHANTEASTVKLPLSQSTNKGLNFRKVSSNGKGHTARTDNRTFGTSASSKIELSVSQQEELKVANNLRQRLQSGLHQVSEIKKDPSIVDGFPIDAILKTLPQDGNPPLEQKLIERLATHYAGQPYKNVKEDLNIASSYRNTQQRKVTDEKAKNVLIKLGVLDTSSIAEDAHNQSQDSIGLSSEGENDLSNHEVESRLSLKARATKRASNAKRPSSKSSSKNTIRPFPNTSVSTKAQSVEAQSLEIKSVDLGNEINLPQLSFDLSRVLFNPGIYQLRDPRSRVYNFDPYLEQIMPVSEFNFDALNPYLTSSEDTELLKMAHLDRKRYIGSSSSMTSALAQFHFIISSWRELNTSNFTRGFDETLRTFTAINRSPAAIFLRWRNGVYAVDADKEYDEPNVLMSLGKSMEKLLTLEKDEFEKWRKTNSSNNNDKLESLPESFHYSTQGRFLLRSQLDCWDPRLPGTGYFDLKTRAVAGIRMNLREHETGMGYQIKDRFGTWESYEREYYDMMRSTFLKYSLQARIGNMDGIFVAYHNISRMFGFQYIPISEMDLVLHGQSDPCLGDQEFRLSLNLMEEIFNLGTQTFPEQSLRIHFDARDASVSEPKPYMQIFIEPMSEDEIKNIQDSQKAQSEAFERKLLRGEDPGVIVDSGTESEQSEGETQTEIADKPDESETKVSPWTVASSTPMQTSPSASAADTTFLDNLLNTAPAHLQPKPSREILAMKLKIQNKINDRPVLRPESITPAAKWKVEYQLERMGDDVARRMYTFCKSRRMSALKTVINRSSDDYFTRTIRQMSERGAEWRKQQDELDADRDRVVLYDNGQSK